MKPLLIPAGNPGSLTGVSGNNTYFIDGRVPTLIDAGVGAASHLDAVARALANRPLVQVLVTHGHRDHISGAPALLARWPGVAMRKMPVDGDDTRRWHPLQDGARVAVGDGEVRVVATPGHAVDHVCLFHEATGDLFGGDMIIMGTTVMIPRKGGHLQAYLASLERMAALRPARILPGHGPVIGRPLKMIAQYLEHRRIREQQVLACLADGVTDIDEIVTRVYVGLPPALVPAARQTIEAHLQKIHEDRDAERQGR